MSTKELRASTGPQKEVMHANAQTGSVGSELSELWGAADMGENQEGLGCSTSAGVAVQG